MGQASCLPYEYEWTRKNRNLDTPLTLRPRCHEADGDQADGDQADGDQADVVPVAARTPLNA